MVENYHTLSCNISIKKNFLYSYLDKLPKNLGDKEQSDSLCPDIIEMEICYQERLITSSYGILQHEEPRNVYIYINIV